MEKKKEKKKGEVGGGGGGGEGTKISANLKMSASFCSVSSSLSRSLFVLLCVLVTMDTTHTQYAMNALAHFLSTSIHFTCQSTFNISKWGL